MAVPPPIRWLCACLLACGLRAQDGGRLPFSVVGPDQGLPPGSVACIAQDAEGFIWLGSESGLIRHAAGQWRQWTAEDGLPSAFVPQILAAKDGLWIPSLRGIVRFRQGQVARARMDGAPSTAGGGHLAMDRQGRIWISSGSGTYVQREGLDFTKAGWQPASAPFAIAAGPVSGGIFLAHRGGIHAFLPEGASADWGPKDGLPEEGPAMVIEDGQGRVWAGTAGVLAVKAPGEARFEDQSALLPGSLTPNSQPFLDRDGSVWLPTQNGLLHLADGHAETIGPSNGLPFAWARGVFRDREGTLWVLGPELARLEGRGRVRNYGAPSAEVVWWVTRDHAGRMLLGTDDGAMREARGGFQRVPGSEGRRIKSLAEDRAGTLWMVSTTGPALWLRPGMAKAEKAPLGEGGTFVNSVTEDREGRLWFGHSRLGLLRWDPRSARLVPELAPERLGLQALGVFAVQEDARGRIWAGSTEGLLVRGEDGAWHRFTDRDGLEPHNVRGVAFLPDGSAWVHYQEPEGLTRVRIEGGRLTVLERKSKGAGLRTNLVYAIQSDATGRVWISTDQGLDRVDRPEHVGREDGMANEDCSVHALLLEPGRVWVGTGAGLVRYDEPAVGESLAPPAARILAITCGDRLLEPPFSLGIVPHREATLSFRVSAPAFVHEQGLRIQVRLLGLESDWHDLEGHLARYPALPGGSYRFEARAAEGGGPFGPVESIGFRVQPAWWLTWWALALWILLGAALIYGLLRARLAAMARSKADLEAMVAGRTEELRLRNDELTTALTRVKQLSGLLPICANCKKIRDDHGYWTQLESYIADHSEADFTHGICPDCSHELFPEVHGRAPKPDPGGP